MFISKPPNLLLVSKLRNLIKSYDKLVSKLGNLVESYDKYGIHRLNGVKAVYLILILFAGNLFFSLENPYFYYFYLPMTAINAEVVGENLNEKYRLLFYCITMAIITVFLFDIFYISPFFCIFAFFYSAFLYLAAINYKHHAVIIAPISLSLGAYSLLYKDLNTNFYTTLNNCLTSFVAMGIIFAALICFPRGYYYRLWLKSLVLLLQQIITYLSELGEKEKPHFNQGQINQAQIDQNQTNQGPINQEEIDQGQSHIRHLVNFSMMLPRSLPIYSILKINLLINRLYLNTSIAPHTLPFYNANFKLLIKELQLIKTAVEQEKSCELNKSALGNALGSAHGIIDKFISSWNYLCLKQ